MRRYNVHLKDEQIEKLQKIAEAEDDTVARLIRVAVAQYIKKKRHLLNGS